MAAIASRKIVAFLALLVTLLFLVVVVHGSSAINMSSPTAGGHSFQRALGLESINGPHPYLASESSLLSLPHVQSDRLVFSSNETGNWEIYSISPAGTGIGNISNNPDADDVPLFLSPDNHKVFFSSESGHERKRFSVNVDGSNLTDVSVAIVDPAKYPGLQWSPDRTKIVYELVNDQPKNNDSAIMQSSIVLANADGSNKTKLTQPDYYYNLGWVPDGQHVAFAKFNNTTFEYSTYLMDLTNSSSIEHPTLVKPLAVFAGGSPDGKQVVYGYPLGYSEVANATDGNPLAGLDRYVHTKWSPDSTKLAVFNGHPNMGTWMSIFDPRSQEERAQTIRISERDFGLITGAWSPDSKNLAILVSNQTGDAIYTLDASHANSIADLTPVISSRGSSATHYRDLMWATTEEVLPTPDLSMVSIKAIDQQGRDISGIRTVIYNGSDGSLVKSGYSPIAFTGEVGQKYKVAVANYDGKIFQQWDDSSTSNVREITLTKDAVSITADYDTGDSLRGFTPLALSGGMGQHGLSVDAKSLKDNRLLHMWVIIDPQTTNSTTSSTTTYKVYAGEYGGYAFDHWSDGNRERIRTLAINESTTLTAYYTSP